MSVRDVEEYTFDDPDDGWFGQAAVMDPEPESSHVTNEIPPVDDNPSVGAGRTDTDDVGADDVIADDAADTDTWYVPFADPHSAEFVEDLLPEPVQEGAPEDPTTAPFDSVPAPPPRSWESRLSTSGAWDFKTPSSSPPRYRSKYAVVAAVVAVAAALVAVAFLVRGQAPAGDDSTTVAPSESSQPAPTSSAPALSSQAPAPVPPPGMPPPPPPPPPSAEEISPPVVNRQYSPNYGTPDTPQKPQMNVTRAPMSATPPPPPAPDRNSSTPGDAPRRRHGFF